MFCDRCLIRFDKNENIKWDETCSFGSMQITVCPKCNKVTVLKFINDFDYRKQIIKHNYYFDDIDEEIK